MTNYFNTLNLRQQLEQLGCCRFMEHHEFDNGLEILKNKKIVIIGCGAQGFNQGLNMRDSGLDVSFALRQAAIDEKRLSFQQASENNFKVGNYQELIPEADVVINLTPDKQHSNVIADIMPLMKKGSILGYSHGLHIVECGAKIRDDITVIMAAPKCPGTEVREEYKRGFGVPTLIAVHKENDPNKNGLEYAKAWAVALGSHKAGVLESSFVAEVKSDLMGEQTILCGMLQAGSIVCYNHLIAQDKDPAYAGKLIQYGWEVITEALKQGGITLMMDRLSNSGKLRAFELAEKIKITFTPLFEKHMDDILSGKFSSEMMKDWANNDADLLKWREEAGKSAFENAPQSSELSLDEQEYFDNGILMVAMIKAGVELCFDTMVSAGIYEESAYYESLHELPLIANTIARKRLYEMNVVISDTAEYGNYLFANQAVGIFEQEIMPFVIKGDLGESTPNISIDNILLRDVNYIIRHHPIEIIGEELRGYMTNMKSIV